MIDLSINRFHSIMFAFILIIGLMIVTNVESAEKFSCDLKDLDNQMTKIVGYLGDIKYSYPKTPEQFKKYCLELKEGENYIKKFVANKCVTGSSKTIISVFAYSSNKANKKFCSGRSNSKAKLEMSTVADCVNNNKKSVMQCYQKYLNSINVTESIQNERNKIPYLCCATEDMRICVLKTLEKLNDPKCSDKVLDSVANMIDNNGGNLLNTFCDGIDNTNRCKKLMKEPKSKPVPVSNKTPFPILFRVFATL